VRTVFDVAIVISLLAVLTTLGLGFYSLRRGGEFAQKYSNKLMRLRVLFQFIAILVLVAAFWWNRTHGH
jgi:hypothetical protein